MKRLIKYQYIAIFICCLPFLAFLIADLTRDYRYSELRYIWSIGTTAVFALWALSFVLGIINLVIISTLKKNRNHKIIWSTISLLPIIVVAILMGIALLRAVFNGTFF